MAQNYEGVFTDYKGNKEYPQTYSHLVFCPDGETVQEKLIKQEDSAEKTEDLIAKVNELNNDLNNLRASGDIEGYEVVDGNIYIKYKVGADTVRKKLGEPTVRTVGVSWHPHNQGDSYSVHVGTGYELYKTLFPIHQQGGPYESGKTGEAYYGYAYNPDNGILTISVSSRYIAGNSQVFTIYILD